MKGEWSDHYTTEATFGGIYCNSFVPQRYDMKDVLSGAYLLSEIDKETVVELLELLVPEKLRYKRGQGNC